MQLSFQCFTRKQKMAQHRNGCHGYFTIDADTALVVLYSNNYYAR